LPEKELPPVREHAIEFTVIKNAGEFFSDVFTLLRRQPRVTGLGLVAVSAVFLGMSVFFNAAPLTTTYGLANFPTATFQGWWEALDWEQSPVLFWGQIVLFWGIGQLTLSALHREMSPEQRLNWQRPFFGLHQVVALCIPFLVIWFLESVESGLFLWLVSMAIFPFFGLWVAVAYYEGTFWSSIPRAWALMRWNQGYLFGFLVVNMGLLLFLFLDSSIWRDVVLPFFSWLVPAEEGNVQTYMAATTAFMSNFVALFVWLMMIAGGAIHYFSSREIADATHLREGIEQVGAARQIRGLARE
jgi:hypothetical protein